LDSFNLLAFEPLEEQARCHQCILQKLPLRDRTVAALDGAFGCVGAA
jgi:hypothetical protein